jgi:hypothetical protein
VELSGRSRRAGREREHTESRRLKKAVPLALVAAPVTYLPVKGVVEAVAAARRAKTMAERSIFGAPSSPLSHLHSRFPSPPGGGSTKDLF